MFEGNTLASRFGAAGSYISLLFPQTVLIIEPVTGVSKLVIG